jgi:SAM-dependent methyltransferase
MDVAAGTGKLARQVAARGARCVAIEPSAAMRDECARLVGDVAVVGGSSEFVPVASDTADLVTVAQAFHWFDAPRALHELARVLRPGGALALVWNERDLADGWAKELDQILRRAGSEAQHQPEAVRPRFDGDAHFEPFVLWQGRHEEWMTPAGVEDMVASRSYVRVLEPAARNEVLAEVRQVVAPLGPSIAVPYVASAYCARARPGPCRCAGVHGEAPWSG